MEYKKSDQILIHRKSWFNKNCNSFGKYPSSDFIISSMVLNKIYGSVVIFEKYATDEKVSFYCVSQDGSWLHLPLWCVDCIEKLKIQNLIREEIVEETKKILNDNRKNSIYNF